MSCKEVGEGGRQEIIENCEDDEDGWEYLRL